MNGRGPSRPDSRTGSRTDSAGRTDGAGRTDSTSSTAGGEAATYGVAGRREWAGLAVLTLPILLVSMDMTVLHLAVPQLAAALAPSGTQLLWIVDIYAFMVAGLLITMGAVGDRIGRRRLLLIGAVAFAAASVAAALASTPGMLIAARAVLGVAGATLAPSTLALIRTMFPDPRQRSVATSVWVLAFLAGASIGPVVGGLLLQGFWWGSVFLLGVPVMAVLLVAGPVLLPEYRDPTAAGIDVPSAGLSLGAVLAVVYGLKETAAGGPAVLPMLVFAVGVVLAVTFIRRQRRLSPPLLDLALFAQRPFAVAIGVLTLGVLVLAGVGFLTAQYLQLVLGLTPLAAGLWTLPPLGAGVTAVVLSQATAARVTVAVGTGGGLLVAAAGLVALSRLPVTGLGTVVVGLALLFAGLMPVLARGVDTVTAAAAPERAGAAAALSETTQELGGALGIALFGSIATAVYRTRLDPFPADVPAETAKTAGDTLALALRVTDQLPDEVLADAVVAFVDGLQVAAVCGATVVIAAAAVAATVLRTTSPGRPTSQPPSPNIHNLELQPWYSRCHAAGGAGAR